jgi:uncharacterized protein
MHWDFAIILLFLGLIVPWLGRRRIQHLIEIPATSKLDRLTLYASTIAFQWLAVGVILWRSVEHNITRIQLGVGIPGPALTITISVILSAVLFANQILSIKRLASQPRKSSGILAHLVLKVFPQDSGERLAFFALVVTVAICEELIYRGFVQFLFQDMAGSVLVGVLLSAIMFALAHFYQGRRGLASTFAVGLIFAGARAWTNSLLPSVTAHFVTDVTVGFLAPIRLRRSNAVSPSQGDGSSREDS